MAVGKVVKKESTLLECILDESEAEIDDFIDTPVDIVVEPTDEDKPPVTVQVSAEDDGDVNLDPNGLPYSWKVVLLGLVKDGEILKDSTEN